MIGRETRQHFRRRKPVQQKPRQLAESLARNQQRRSDEPIANAEKKQRRAHGQRAERYQPHVQPRRMFSQPQPRAQRSRRPAQFAPERRLSLVQKIKAHMAAEFVFFPRAKRDGLSRGRLLRQAKRAGEPDHALAVHRARRIVHCRIHARRVFHENGVHGGKTLQRRAPVGGGHAPQRGHGICHPQAAANLPRLFAREKLPGGIMPLSEVRVHRGHAALILRLFQQRHPPGQIRVRTFCAPRARVRLGKPSVFLILRALGAKGGERFQQRKARQQRQKRKLLLLQRTDLLPCGRGGLERFRIERALGPGARRAAQRQRARLPPGGGQRLHPAQRVERIRARFLQHAGVIVKPARGGRALYGFIRRGNVRQIRAEAQKTAQHARLCAAGNPERCGRGDHRFAKGCGGFHKRPPIKHAFPNLSV